MLTLDTNYNYRDDKTAAAYNLLNLLSIEDDAVISIDGSHTAIYKLTGIDYYLQTDNALNKISGICDLFLSLLPDDFIVTFIYKIGNQDPCFIESYKSSANPPKEFEFVKDKKIEDLRNRIIKKVDIYLYATVKSLDLEKVLKTGLFLKVINSAKSLLKPQDVVVNHNAALEKLTNFTRNLSFLVSSAGLNAKRLNNQELFDYLFKELNPGRTVEPPLLKNMDGSETLRSSLVYSPISVSKKYLSVGTKAYKFINMHKLPKNISTFGVTELVNLASKYYFFNYSIAVSFFVPEQEKKYQYIQDDANIKRSMAESTLGDYNDRKGINEADIIDNLLDSVAKLGKKFIEVSLSFRVEDNIEKDAETVIHGCKYFNGMETIDDKYEYLNIFLSYFPGTQHLNFRKKTMTSLEAANFFPLHQGFLGTKKAPIALLNSRLEPVSLDLLNNSLPAKHGVVFGKTRSGKGFTMNGFLSNYFLSDDNIDIVGVDIGGTYEKFTRLFGGNYIDIELDGRYNLNPFPYKRDVITPSGDYNAEILNFLSHIVMMMVLPNTKPEPNDFTIALRAIMSAYDITPLDENPTFSDVNNQLFNYKEGRDLTDKQRAMALGKNMFRWTDITSPYLDLINQKGTIDLSNRINVFDLQKLSQYPDLQKLVFAIIKNLTFKKMYDRQRKVIMFYDECWQFLADPEVAELVLHLFKASAKWDCAVYAITQQPGDLLKTQVGKSIIENS
ncbi:MAG: TraG/VirB4 family ATPase, partial [bacterium]